MGNKKTEPEAYQKKLDKIIASSSIKNSALNKILTGLGQTGKERTGESEKEQDRGEAGPAL